MIQAYDAKKIIDALKYCAYGERSCDKCPVGKECKGMTNKAMMLAIEWIETEATKNQPHYNWISVKDRLPEEHDSMFAQFYGTSRWNGAMWRTESDRVFVAILFPDGTRTVDKGKLQDGEWRTGVARVLPQKVTHWAVWPEPPKEDE